MEKEEQFLLFSTIFCYLLLDFHVKTGTRFHFEISEVEITRVDCILIMISANIIIIISSSSSRSSSSSSSGSSRSSSSSSQTFTR